MEVKEHDDWARIHCVVDCVHKPTCSHVLYLCMRTHLIRSGLWNKQAQSNLHHLAGPPWLQSVAISHRTRKFSKTPFKEAVSSVVSNEHRFLEGITMAHNKNVERRFFASHALTATDRKRAIYALEDVRILQFWPSCSTSIMNRGLYLNVTSC